MECEIKFNGNSDRTFYAGQDLVGVVVLSLSERKTVLGDDLTSSIIKW